ncbi:hypothetical protein F4860DRAFT_465757 [Xylaria cubensis]|nr:hypothetical protein F4860DRAFT_465757 [Xylaria cubensis]
MWKSEKNSLLWLYGIPGCGKTVLASTIIENLRNDKNSLQGLLYFYFGFNDAKKQHLNDALRSLIKQLYLKRYDVRNHLDLLIEEDGSQPSLKKLVETFRHMIKEISEIWIVLDALDECPAFVQDVVGNEHPRRELLSWIKNLWNSQMNIHLLITSRPEQDIKEAIESCPCNKTIVPIQNDLVGEDIRAYIHTRVREHQGLKRWQSHPEVQKEIESQLIEKAGGMFRWVSC